MRYRGFRYQGDVLDTIYTTEGETFGVSEDAAISAVAESLGVDAGDVTAFESDTEPKPTRAVPAPPEPPTPERPVLTDDEIAALKQIAAERAQG